MVDGRDFTYVTLATYLMYRQGTKHKRFKILSLIRCDTYTQHDHLSIKNQSTNVDITVSTK